MARRAILPPHRVRAGLAIARGLAWASACSAMNILGDALRDTPDLRWRCRPRREEDASALGRRGRRRDLHEGRRGKHRVLRLAPRLAHALRLEAGDLVEMLGRHAAPLRAWVRVEDVAPEGQVALDALGRRILGVSPGDGVEIRRLETSPTPAASARRQ